MHERLDVKPFATLDAIARHWAATAPDAAALVDGDRLVSWRALGFCTDACARMLASASVDREDRVAIVAENCLELVALLFATSARGACAVIVNPRLSARELDAILDHAQPRCVVAAVDVSAEAAAHAERLGASRTDVAGLRTLGISMRVPEASEDIASAPGQQLAAIVYTSGTSGRPKGVMLTHANLLFVAQASARLRALGPDDRVLGVLPICHVFGLASMLLGTCYAGACLYLFPRFEAARTLAAIEHARLTVVQGVPAMYAKLLSQLGPHAKVHAPALRFLSAGGSPLDATLKARVEFRFGATLHNGYGLTECSPSVSQTRLHAPRTDTSVGHAIPGVGIRIVEPSLRDAARGDIGELWVRGPNVMKGYFRDADATSQAMTPDGWLRTGDLARQQADGALFIVGRLKELIIRSGFNVLPGEVEAVLNACPGVSQSVVVGRAGHDGNEDVIAFVELVPGCAAGEREIQAFAAADLAPYKRPVEIRVLDALPASPSGKVLRHELKRLAQRSSS